MGSEQKIKRTALITTAIVGLTFGSILVEKSYSIFNSNLSSKENIKANAEMKKEPITKEKKENEKTDKSMLNILAIISGLGIVGLGAYTWLKDGKGDY